MASNTDVSYAAAGGSGGIGYDKNELQQRATEAKSFYKIVSAECQYIQEELSLLNSNWSGEERDMASEDLINSKISVDTIEDGIKQINDVVQNANSQFEGVKYNGGV